MGDYASTPSRKWGKRKCLSLKQKQTVLRVFRDLERDRRGEKDELVEVCSDNTGVPKSTVYKILRECKIYGEVQAPKRSGGRKRIVVNEDAKNAIRRVMQSFSLRNEVPTLQTILEAIRDQEPVPQMGRETLRKLLHELEFTDGKGRNANKDQGKSESHELPQPQEPPQPQFENIYVDETTDQHVDIKKEILDPEESFDALTTDKIMQVMDYDKNGHSIEQQMNLMEENVFIKREEILENFDVRTNTSFFDLNIKNEEMTIKDEVDIVEDYVNQRLASVSIPVIGVGFCEANSNNLPKIDLLTIMEYFHEHDNSIFAEIRRLKTEPLIRKNHYEDNTIGYVQVKQEASFCEIKASISPENDITPNNCNVWCRINTVINVVLDVSCQNCPGNQGGCIHCVAFLMWLYRKSVDPPLAEEVSYWKKPELKGNQTRNNVTTDDSGKRKVAAEDSLSQGCKKRKIQSNIDTYHNPEFNSLSLQCLATSFKKCSLRKNAENFQKFSELHLNPELILNVEEVTRDRSRSSLWKEMRYGRVPSSKAYDVIRCKTIDESLEESVLGANICDSEATSPKVERKNKVLSMLSSETSMQFFKTGIFLSSENPFVEATPDAINDTFVVEIKCPKTEKSLHEYLDSDGNMKQKYFYQMQLLMRLAKKDKGMFVIAQEDFESSKKLIINYCDYDEYFATTILTGINEFWTKNIYNKVL